MAHDLFPNHPDADISWIVVSRLSGDKMETAPQMYSAVEMPDLHTLGRTFGGGKYTVYARDSSRGRITASVVAWIHGPPKMLINNISNRPMGEDCGDSRCAICGVR